ncbi:MAG: sugar phosphate isomerase/epimerase [Phycisphaeraceae bacterium]|nr:sugar phosphate isomerase/epimerase [Phycisphaeraceae bacterium]
MKLSFMTFACPEWTLTQVLDAAHRHGYQGVELRVDAHHLHGVEVETGPALRRDAARMIRDSGIEPCCLATSLQLVNPASVNEAGPLIGLAQEMGAPALRVFCGPLPDGVDVSEAIDRVATHLHHVCLEAVQAGVQLWLETHDTFSKAHDAAAAVHRADHPSAGINYDNMHPFRKGESIEATFAAMGDLIRHTHFHDAMNHPDQVAIKPVGEGEMPMEEMFAALVKAGYTGYLSGEWFGTMYGADPESSLARFRDDMTQLADPFGIKFG